MKIEGLRGYYIEDVIFKIKKKRYFVHISLLGSTASQPVTS